jgi:hypothetical protein
MEKKKHPGGRPSKYNAQFHPLLAESLARNGLTDVQISERLGITEATLCNWKNAHPEFFESIKRGKEDPDELIEESLFKNAKGKYVKVQKPVVVSDGSGLGSHVETVEYMEYIPPNVTAQIFWLKNRRPAKWRDKQQVEHSGYIEELSPEQRRARLAELEAKRKE